MPRDDRDEFEIEDASIGFSKQRGGGRACLTGLDDVPRFRPEKGKSYDLILVPFLVSEAVNAFADDCRNASPGKWYYEQSFAVHGGVGPNNETHTCLARTFNAPCPVCEDVRRLNQSPHKQDKELAAGLRPRNRQLFLPYDLNDRSVGVQWWEEAQWNFGRHLKEFIGGARAQDRDSWLRFYHPRQGYELRVTAVERAMGSKKDGDRGGTNVEYVVNGFYPMREPIPDNVLRHGIDLSKCVKRLSYQALKDLYDGRSGQPAPAESANGHARPDDRGHFGARDDRGGFGGRAEQPAPRRDDPPARVRPPADDDQPPARRPQAAPVRDDRDDAPPARRPAAAEQPARRVEPDLPAFSKGDRVRFTYKGTDHVGEIVGLDHDRQLAKVEVADYDRPFTVDFRDLTADEPEPAPRQRGRAADPEPEPAPARKPAGRAAPTDWDDGDDAPPPRRPAAANPDRNRAAGDDGDDKPFKRNTRAAAEPEPEPAPAKRGRGKAAEADPEPAPKRGGRAAADDDDEPPRRTRGK